MKISIFLQIKITKSTNATRSFFFFFFFFFFVFFFVFVFFFFFEERTKNPVQKALQAREKTNRKERK